MQPTDPVIAALQGNTNTQQISQSPSDPVIAALGGKQEQTSSVDATPQDVRSAEEVTGSHDFDGLCETFVEKSARLPNMGATAADAWNNWVKQGKAFQGVQNAPKGALLYFAPDDSNQQSGHVAINKGNGAMVSATDLGVREDNITDWINSTKQRPLGYVVPR